MSRKRKRSAGAADPQEVSASPETEVPSGVEEEGGGKLPPNPELEAALREAEESVDAMRPQREEEAEERERLARELQEERERRLRLQADFENFRKRTDRERVEALHFGAQNLVKDLLSVVDNLERAIGHARESEGGDLQGLLQGVELVERELRGTLGNHHVSEVEAQGKAFDPAVHEAMAQLIVEGEEPNRIIEVLQKGYQLRDRLVRPARVVVTKAAEPVEQDPEEGQETAD